MAMRLNVDSGSAPSHASLASAGTTSIALETLSQAGAAYAKACGDWQAEMTRFVGARIEQDQKLGQSLSGCRNLNDALQILQNWAFTAAQDYLNEFNRLCQIALGFFRAGAQPCQPAERGVPPEST